MCFNTNPTEIKPNIVLKNGGNKFRRLWVIRLMLNNTLNFILNLKTPMNSYAFGICIQNPLRHKGKRILYIYFSSLFDAAGALED